MSLELAQKKEWYKVALIATVFFFYLCQTIILKFHEDPPFILFRKYKFAFVQTIDFIFPF